MQGLAPPNPRSPRRGEQTTERYCNERQPLNHEPLKLKKPCPDCDVDQVFADGTRHVRPMFSFLQACTAPARMTNPFHSSKARSLLPVVETLGVAYHTCWQGFKGLAVDGTELATT